MQPDRSVTKSCILSDGLLDGAVTPSKEANGYDTIPIHFSASVSSSSFSHAGVNCIEHRVTKMDTLAGVAIKYGVEVSDIRRMNGLVTDLQMFAHKSLQIPLPGRHPPSPIMSDNSIQNGEKTPPHRSHDDSVGSLHSLNSKPPLCRVSPAMCSLQRFYGLTQTNKAGKTIMLEDQILSGTSPTSDPIRSRHSKSRSLVNVMTFENGDTPEDALRTPAILLKEDVNGGAFSGREGKGLCLRSKPSDNTSVVDPLLTDASVSVRKSSSTSNLCESAKNRSSIWPTSRWSLKPDAITRPIFDGLPKSVAAMFYLMFGRIMNVNFDIWRTMTIVGDMGSSHRAVAQW